MIAWEIFFEVGLDMILKEISLLPSFRALLR